ncbi:hypothetical protein HDU92_003930 [Lobulomyces angularis]|nr:hypothetical protein HDU92_003930 [Lobulomyces angularis]
MGWCELIMRTNGGSICMLLSATKPKKEENIPRVKKRKKPEKTEYFQDNLEDLHSNKVYINPNKRTCCIVLVGNGNKLRYTQMQRRKESGLKRYQKNRQKLSNQVACLNTQVSVALQKRNLSTA